MITSWTRTAAKHFALVDGPEIVAVRDVPAPRFLISCSHKIYPHGAARRTQYAGVHKNNSVKRVGVTDRAAAFTVPVIHSKVLASFERPQRLALQREAFVPIALLVQSTVLVITSVCIHTPIPAWVQNKNLSFPRAPNP